MYKSFQAWLWHKPSQFIILPDANSITVIKTPTAMKGPKRRFTRKEFIKTSSMGALATGMMAGAPVRLLADGKKLATATLGSTGLTVTKLGIGAPRIQEASVLRYALDNGITFIDTGRRYANGKNEEMVGEVIKGKRKDFVIQSKLNINIDRGKGKSNRESVSAKIRDQFNKSVEESLRALGTDYIDVMLFHDGDDELLYHEAVLEAFTNAKKEGKILAAGFSVHSNLVEIVKKHNSEKFFDVIMASFNPHAGYQRITRNEKWDQQALITELKKAADAGTGIVAMKTCLGGTWQCEGDAEATYPGAVKWVLAQPYIHTSAVAMASFQQLDEHLSVHKS